VITEELLQAEPTATLPKPNLGELSRQVLSQDQKFPRGKEVGTLPRFITIYQDEIPVGGGEDFNVEKNEFY
jgi:hypothetical protein